MKSVLSNPAMNLYVTLILMVNNGAEQDVNTASV